VTVKHEMFNVSTTRQALIKRVVDKGDGGVVVMGPQVSRSVVIQNGGSGTIFLGDETVTSASHGFHLAPNESIAFDLTPTDEIWAVALSSQSISVLHLGV
jgi:hypothetical protein